MNTIKKLLPFIFGINLAYAQEDQTLYSARGVSTQESSTDTILQNIEKYLQNLGTYLGYDLTVTPTTNSTDTLLDVSIQKNLESTTIKMYFGFISTQVYFPYFFPNDSSNPYQTLNTLAAQVFSEQSYSNDDTRAKIDYTQSSINANLEKTPVSQYVLNMLNITPSDVCYDTSTGTPYNWLQSCDYPYNEVMIMGKTLGLFSTDGELRATSTNPAINALAKSVSNINFSTFFPGKDKNLDTNLYLLKQLDSTAFIGPLMYDTGSNTSSESSTKPPSNETQQGLLTNTQLDAAQNYVRYLTGSIKPRVFVTNEDFNSIISGISKSTAVSTQLNYFKPFAKYVLDFRIYASRISLAVQNIYDSLAYRMTIPSSSSSGTDESASSSSQSSQALNEYVMASYRLYNPNTETQQSSGETSLKTTAWQEMINSASSATVQKEMAVLLAEINYQLYQMRQQQEKLILTNSVFLLNNLTEPSLSVPSTEDAASTSTPPS